MAADDERLFTIAGEILDGAGVDWPSAGAGLSDSARAVFQELRALAALSSVQRRVHQPSALPTPEALPATWGHLTLKAVIAAGAFGTVYRAWDATLEREVALKLLPESDQTLEEARLLARVRHPNVVTIYGADRIGGCTGLWMELVGGTTLEELLAREERLSPARVAEVATQLCAALAALHNAGLVHRDVKANNVMLEHDGRVVLMDFGSASIGSTRDMAGTPLYLAPEIFDGRPATPSSDLYSLGVLLYRLLSGQFPVSGHTFAEVRRAHQRTWHAPDVRQVRFGVPRRLARAVTIAMSRRPEDRFQSADRMAAALAADSRIRLIAAAAVLVASVAAAVALSDAGRGLVSVSSRQAPGFVPDDALTARQFQLPEHAAVFSHGLAYSGTHLSFAGNDGSLSVLDTATNRPTLVRRAEQGGFVEMSIMAPDAKAVAYEWWTADNQSELRVIGRDGTSDRLLLRNEHLDYVMPVEWSRDGTTVIVVEGEAAGSCTVSAIDVDSGRRSPLARLAYTPTNVSLSPDNGYLAYDQPIGTSGTRRINVLDLRTSDVIQLASRAGDRFPLWTPDGQLFFLSDRSGTVDAWVQRMRDGSPDGPPTVALRNQVRVTPLGFTAARSYYYRLQSGTFDLVTLQLGAGRNDPVAVGRAFGGRFSGSNIAATYSPDGGRIAYISVRDGLRAGWERVLVVHDLSAEKEHDLSAGIEFGFAAPRWSPGGRLLLLRGRHRSTNRRGLFVVDADSGELTHTVLTFLDRDQSEIAPIAWGPDDRTVWFQQTGRGIVARDLATGAERVMVAAVEGVRYTGFGSDPVRGRVVSSSVGNAIARLSVHGSGEAGVLVETRLPENLRFLDWSEDGQDVFFLRGRQGAASLELWRVNSSAPGSEELVARLPGATFTNPPSVNAAGTEVTYTAGTPVSEFWLVDHFPH